ncbi:MAG: recombinase family protein [Actinobacteria bacterium]|nr:recombinase family protein [Actinomycetota bacterium]
MGRVAVGALDRECPRCGAREGIKCRDLRRPKKTAPATHIARGWLDRPCPSCRAQPGERCHTPGGRPTEPHQPRWEQPRLPAQRYGYAHASPSDPYADLQRDALTAAGCIRIWTDRARVSGDGRSERARLLAYLRPADVLVVWRLDALADTAAELAEVARVLQERTIALVSDSEQLDSTLPGGRQLFAAITAIAALQPDGAGASRPARRGARRRGGRPPLLSAQAHTAIRALHDGGGHTIDEIAAMHDVSRPTVYRSLKRTASHN